MKQDYLWNRSGVPDPEIQKLEDLLHTFAYSRPVPEIPTLPLPRREFRWFRELALAACLRPIQAALAVVALAVLASTAWWLSQPRPAYEVFTLDGLPRVGNERSASTARLGVGQMLITDGSSRARIQVGTIGQVEVEPNTRIRLIEADQDRHRLMLERGIVHALIVAPPRLFLVDTPSAQAVDLGCMYTLEVNDDGSGLLRVTAGWVAFLHGKRESFVPSGAICLMTPAKGPGTPFREDASPAFRTALQKFDSDDSNASGRAIALGTLAREARKEDSLTLWHLLQSGERSERAAVYDALAALVAPPDGVTREGILRRDQRLIDLWWNELGLGSTNWWRQWEHDWPDSR